MCFVSRSLSVVALLASIASQAFAAWPDDPNVNLPVCTAAGDQAEPRIAMDGAGGAYIVWQDDRDPGTPYDRGIYAQHVLAEGVVDPAWPINGHWLGQGFQPDISTVGIDGAVVAWSSSPQLNDGRCRAQRIGPSGVAPGWPTGGVLLTQFAMNGTQAARVAADAGGGAFVTWETASFVHAQHIGPSGEVVGLPWLVSLTQGSWGGLIRDGVGGVLSGWGEAGGPGTVRVQHFSWAYDPLDPWAGELGMWSSGGVAAGFGSPLQFETALAGDGDGGGFVAWQFTDGGTGTQRIVVQHLLANGAADSDWPAGGRVVKSAVGLNLLRPELVTDDAGGVIVAWLDDSPPLPPVQNVLLMHLLADGTIDPTWPVGGRSMGSMPIGSQSWPGPRMVADGSGGTIIAWTGRGWDHIYAQRVLSDGTLDPAWPPATGTTVSAGPNKYDPMSVPDGSGGAIITWYESRPGGNGLDIYAQRVRSDGRLGEEVSGVQDVAPFGLVLQPIRPNPLRTETFAVPFRVGGDGAVSIEVFDVAGRRITSRQLASVEPGFHSIEVSLGPSPVAGIYFVRLQQGTLVRTTTVTLLD